MESASTGYLLISSQWTETVYGQLTLSLVARKQTLGTFGSEEVVRVIMVDDMGTVDDEILKPWRGACAITVVTTVSGICSSIDFLVVSCNKKEFERLVPQA